MSPTTEPVEEQGNPLPPARLQGFQQQGPGAARGLEIAFPCLQIPVIGHETGNDDRQIVCLGKLSPGSV